MAVRTDDQEKMIKTCRAILETCDQPFVWEDDDQSEIGNAKKPFGLFLPHPAIDQELQALLAELSGRSLMYDQIVAICELNEEWFETGTYGLDRDFTRYFRKYTLKPEYVEPVKSYFNNRLRELAEAI